MSIGTTIPRSLTVTDGSISGALTANGGDEFGGSLEAGPYRPGTSRSRRQLANAQVLRLGVPVANPRFEWQAAPGADTATPSTTLNLLSSTQRRCNHWLLLQRQRHG